VAAHYAPGGRVGVGGDFYDAVTLPNGNLALAIGDVMGHGLGSALLMATARGALRASAATGASIENQLSHVNHVLASDVRHGMFMTMTLLAVHGTRREARWVCAGHEPALVYDPATDSFSDLCGGDLPLGIDVSARYRLFARADLPKGAILFLGTDGIWESRNAQREEFGKDRLRQCLRANAARSASEIAAALEQAVRAHIGQAPIRDDATWVVLKFV